jgi:hypothetical protein
MARGFTAAMLAGMTCDGFITVAVDTVRAGAQTFRVRRLRITNAGRMAIKG